MPRIGQAGRVAKATGIRCARCSESGRLSSYDAGKKIKGKKRHLLVDTLGLLLHAVVHPAECIPVLSRAAWLR